MPFLWNSAGSPRRRTLPGQARLQSPAASDHRSVASVRTARTQRSTEPRDAMFMAVARNKETADAFLHDRGGDR